MAYRRGTAGKSLQRGDSGSPAAQQLGAGGPPPPPAGAAAAPAAKRYDWIDSTVGDEGSIKARRAAPRADSRNGGGRAGSPDFWARSTAAALVESSVKNPELKLQLLTRALEESRAKIQHLQSDRAALSDAVLQLCLAAGAPCGGAGQAGMPAAPGEGEEGEEEAVLKQRLDLLSSQLQALQEALQMRKVAVAEAQAQHERAALQVVAGQQQREALEQQLEEARYGALQHQQAQQAMQLKVGLLEEQLGATADSARRRMEEQLDTFRGEAVTARALRTKFDELERQLDAAQRAQRGEEEHSRQLAGQVERLQGRLKEGSVKQAELSQQLWDKSAAHNELGQQHRALQEDSKALAAANSQLQGALAASQQRAQQAETLAVGLQAEWQAGQAGQAALQEEAERLRAELQQEREQAHRLQAALAEEQLTGANQRAALRGRGDELSSLLLKLDEYSNRIVAAEGALEWASQQAAQEAALRAQADGAARQVRHECASLRDSLADLAAAEARWKAELGAAEARLAEAAAAQQASQWRARQQERAAAASAEHVQLLQATLAEQARQLEEMAALRGQCEGKQRQLADLGEEMHAAVARGQAAQLAADELAAAKFRLERELHKQQVLAQRLQEQSSKQGGQLQAASKELEAASACVAAAAAQAAQQREELEGALAAQQQAHAARRGRNEQLEHDNRQQAVIIAELQACSTSLGARLATAQQHSAALHRYAVAHGAAYGRLAAHAAGLHQQLARQLGGLLQLCRHLGLQLAAALSAADPVAALEAAVDGSGSSSSSSGSSGSSGAPAAAGDRPGAEAAVAAAVMSIEGLRIELQVAVQLLELQAGSSEAQQLTAVPAGVAQALEADLAGLPITLLTSPRLEPGAASVAATGNSTTGGSPSASQQQQARGQQSHHSSPTAPAAAAAPSAPAALSAQVAQMESHLERLALGCTEQAARAAAAVQLQEQERAARQRAQDLAADLSSRLAATQADLAATREQREALDAQSRRLARELRDAIYTISQQNAAQQGQAVSWAVRGLRSAAVQTQYCELWRANLGGSCTCRAGTCSAAAGNSSPGSEPCAAQANSSHSGLGSSADASSGGGGGTACTAGVCAEEEEPAGRVLLLPALQQQIREIYRSKSQHDIAVARGQLPFLPLADFVAAYLAQQHGSDGRTVEQRAQQLQASVEAHAGVFEIAMFGLAAGMLVEGEGGAAATSPGLLAGSAADGSPQQLPAASSAASSAAAAGAGASSSAAAAAVPLVLYHRRHCGRGGGGSTAEQQQQQQRRREGALPSLRRFCAASWHAAHQQSSGRRPLPQPFNPAGADQLLPGMASEVHNLALVVPGIEQLVCWVLGGGLGACLPQLDLGLRLVESQVPQLYLLAVESCRLLGISGTPQLYVKNSAEAAVYYLLLPSQTRLHGLNGGLAEQQGVAAGLAVQQPGAASGGSRAGSPGDLQASIAGSGTGSSGSGSSSSSVAAGGGAEGQDWQCAVVLTSGLLDLLEPLELQAVVAGCLGFHAALTSPACREAPQLAVLCRSMAALATLGALCTLGPEALAQRLPHQMAPFFHSRMRPVLLRALRYLSLYCDRVAAAATGSWRTVAAAVVKQAAGCSLLRNELNLAAVLQQARALEEAAAELVPRQLLLHEEAAAVAGAGASLALLRVRELQKWQAGRR